MSLLFPDWFDEVLFWSIFVGGFGGLVWAIKQAGGYKVPDSKRDRTEPLLAIPLFFVGILVVPIVLGYARIGVLPSYLFYPGLLLWIVGLALYAWSVRFLGRFQSGFVRVIAGHRVIQEGPYRLIRHPLYASELVAWIGLGLALQSWAALLAILATSAVFYANRIRVEERFLVAELGDDYIQYMKRTKRIIPFVL
jgi:protein-S-isoprenylcysteine O-methyltransferase Ste14